MKILYAIVIGLLAAAPRAGAQGAAAPPADTVITLERGGCERRCAVYAVTIRADGSVAYDGRHYVRATGRKRSRIAPAAVAELVAAFAAAGFYDLQDQYGMQGGKECTELRRDGPVARTSIQAAGRTKTVVHDHRCVGSFSEPLKRLETAIDRAANTAQWIK